MQKVSDMHYRVVGSGNPILFIHGFLEDSTMWEDITPHFENAMCVSIDLPGHGKSAAVEEAFSIKDLAQSCHHLLKSKNIQPKAIVGHSLGGYLALELIKHFQNQPKLVLLNSHPWEDSKIKKQERKQVAKVVQKNHTLFIRTAIPNLFQNADENQEAINSLISSAEKMNPMSIAFTSLAMANREDNSETLINCDSIVIQGEYDKLIPADRMQKFCEENNVQFELIKGGDHMVHITKQKRVLEVFTLLDKLNTNTHKMC